MEQNKCNKCGRPMQYATKPKCNYCDSCMSEYCGCKLGRIKEIEPTCDSTAVIPSITVESVEGITNLANCLVHVNDINTTFYVDDKHRVMITWAGPVDIPGYDMENNPNGYRDQIVTDIEKGIAVIYDKHGKGYTFGIYDSLDSDGAVTQAINDKLDEMAADGTLTDIIAQYIGDPIFGFNTVADMKTSTTLMAGDKARTLGYHSINDGGGATYYITDTGTANEMDVIAIGTTLYANLILPYNLSPEMFGAYGDGTHDDSSAIQSLIEYAIDNRCNVKMNKKNYIIGSTILIDKTATSLDLIIDGNEATLTGNTAIGTEYLIKLKSPYSGSWGQENITIKNITLEGSYLNKGIDIEHTNFWTLDNVCIIDCLYGLRLCNTYYGNIEDSCRITNCWYGIVLEDSADTTSNEVNTIRIGNISIQMPQSQKANFDTALTTTIGVKIDTLVNAVKFEGTVLEHYDIAMEGFTLANSPATAGRESIFTVDKCYFENIGKVFEFKRQANNNYLRPIVQFTNCRVYPIGNVSAAKVGELDTGKWTVTGNQNFILKIGTSPANLEITTDLDDTFLDITNINDQTYINKIGLPRTTREDDYKNDGYISYRRLNAIQNNNLIYHRFYDKSISSNMELKNYKALSVNAQNICFEQEGPAPVGLIINGDDGKKYMLGTDDGTTIKLTPMNNKSRYFQRANSKTALWLWNNRDRFADGVEFYCIDTEKTVVCSNHNWLDKTDNHIAVGTSPVLAAYTNPSGIYWRPTWDVSFNRGVYWHATRYVLGFDWFKNNDPRPTEILVYGVIASRPASPSQPSYYYATDEQKYYYYDGANWSEISPQV